MSAVSVNQTNKAVGAIAPAAFCYVFVYLLLQINPAYATLIEMFIMKEGQPMQTVRLGRTNLILSKNGFGALPIQRVSKEAAALLLKKAYNSGINFFDTARSYTDSEEKIGLALGDVRDKFVLATKTPALNANDFWKDLDTSLKLLKTDHIDIYQFHNPPFCPKPGDGTGLYEAMLEARDKGIIRFIGITSHRTTVAKEAVLSGLYDTLQFPFSYIARKEELEIVNLCKEHDVGFICMKALSGGLIKHSDIAYAYLAQFDVLPIWGVQRESELDEFISYIDNPPVLTDEMKAFIEKEKDELSLEFCRGCGYCMPCPAGIEINNCARMYLLLRRAPLSEYLSPEWQEKMKIIEGCLHCNKCKSKCPYGLDIPNMLARNYEDYKTFLK